MNDSSTSDEPHVILTTKTTLVKMSKTFTRISVEKQQISGLNVKEFSVKVKHFTEANTESKIYDSINLQILLYFTTFLQTIRFDLGKFTVKIHSTKHFLNYFSTEATTSMEG